jgi:hypothetical protein
MAKSKLKLQSKYWWQEDDERIHEAVMPIVKHLQTSQSYRTERNLCHMRLYGNQNIAGMNFQGYFRDQSPQPQDRIKFNVVKSVIDTVTSKICKNRPKPMFLTEGDFSLKRRAIRLNQYIEGALQGMKLWDMGPDFVRDMGVFDFGSWKFIHNGKKIVVERAFPEEIWVDECEGFYRNPRSKFQTKSIAREVLISDYPDYEAEISQAGKSAGSLTAKSMTDLVDVAEAWHLPTDGRDGKHAICIGNATLLSEEWKLEMFPFVTKSWSNRLVGWYGQGIAEQLVGIQIEMNQHLRTVRECLKWAVPKLFVQHGTSVTPFSNLVMGMYKYTGGVAPEVRVAQTVSPELFQQIDRLYQKAFELIGVSQLSAQSTKPAGLNSGKALREFTDIESDRFVVDGQSYERAFLDAADLVIALLDQDGGMKVDYQGRNKKIQLDWEDVRMARDEFSMTMWPTNLLSSSPAGKLADVQEMLDAGLLTPEDARRLLDYPDVASVTSLYNSPYEIVDDIIEKLLEGESAPRPDAYIKFDIAIPRMQEAYLKAQVDGASETILESFRVWIDQALEVVKLGQAPAPEPAPTGPPQQEALPPEGAPMPPAEVPPTIQ